MMAGMRANTPALVAAGALAAVTLAVTGAAAAGSDDAEPSITGQALEAASAAALAHTGGGRVTDTEVGDEDSYYEVEVTLPDGDQVDVQLDAQFNVVDQMADSEADE
jgi:uncharacterized membrane protein YkoI